MDFNCDWFRYGLLLNKTLCKLIVAIVLAGFAPGLWKIGVWDLTALEKVFLYWKLGSWNNIDQVPEWKRDHRPQQLLQNGVLPGKLGKWNADCCIHVNSGWHTTSGFFTCLAVTITSLSSCVLCNDFVSEPISSKAFDHNSVETNPFKYYTSYATL